MAALRRDTIFTNVAISPSREPWWEGMGTPPPDGLIDWKGEPWDPTKGPAAHPNSRYTVPARRSPSISPHWEDPEGVPISAIIFGGRRERLAPLVYESFNWQHGVFVGATMASETTAATTGAVGVTRRDPMAMIPFCGYNMADYFGHWLEMGRKLKNPPKIFHVNWFRKDANGKFLWPGYGENVRVLKWMLDRIEGRAAATETPIGYVPAPGSLTLDGLDISRRHSGRTTPCRFQRLGRRKRRHRKILRKIRRPPPPRNPRRARGPAQPPAANHRHRQVAPPSKWFLGGAGFRSAGFVASARPEARRASRRLFAWSVRAGLRPALPCTRNIPRGSPAEKSPPTHIRNSQKTNNGDQFYRQFQRAFAAPIAICNTTNFLPNASLTPHGRIAAHD